MKSHLSNVIRERCRPVLVEANEKGCIYFKAYWRINPGSITMIFNNGADIQYSRSLGIERMWLKYGCYPDIMWAYRVVESCFLNQPDIKPMYFGIPRRFQKRPATE